MKIKGNKNRKLLHSYILINASKVQFVLKHVHNQHTFNEFIQENVLLNYKNAINVCRVFGLDDECLYNKVL